MTRINPVLDTNASPEAAALFAAIKGKVGMVPNLYRTTAQRPAVLSALLGLGDALGKGTFDAKTREAIALTVAKANRCDYCASAHSAISASMKVGQEEILANLNGTSGNPRLAAILALASRIVAEKGHLTDADLADARAAGLDDGDIIEVAANVVANIFTNYINHIAQTDIDFPVVATAA